MYCQFSVLSLHTASLYSCNILFAFLINGTIPIYYEITVEGVYPVAEGITTGVLSWLNAFTGIIFLFVMAIPSIGKSTKNDEMLSHSSQLTH